MVDNIIQMERVNKYFGTVHALNKFNLTVKKGEIMGFVGPNGAGKSTTIRILLGLLKIDSGSVKLFGKNPFTDAVNLHKKIAFVPGEVALWPNLTGGETIDFLSSLHGEDIKSDAYKQKKLKYVKLFDLDLAKKSKTYSKGNKQKIALITAFIVNSELLLLDEPTSGLDPLLEDVFTNCIKEIVSNGKTVLLSSHIISEVEKLCDMVTIIKNGRDILTQTPQNIRAHTDKDLEDAIVDMYI